MMPKKEGKNLPGVGVHQKRERSYFYMRKKGRSSFSNFPRAQWDKGEMSRTVLVKGILRMHQGILLRESLGLCAPPKIHVEKKTI